MNHLIGLLFHTEKKTILLTAFRLRVSGLLEQKQHNRHSVVALDVSILFNRSLGIFLSSLLLLLEFLFTL